MSRHVCYRAAGGLAAPRPSRQRMIRRGLALAALVMLVAGCATGGGAATRAAEGPVTQRPTYNVGDRWYRSDGEFVLDRIEKDQYVFFTRGREIRMSSDLAIARVQDGPYWVEMDPPIALKWPLRVGQYGQVTGYWRWHDRPTGVQMRLIWTVDAYEAAPTGAGDVKAFRITLDAETGMGTWKRTQTLWFAPDKGYYVAAEGPRDMMPLARFFSHRYQSTRTPGVPAATPSLAAPLPTFRQGDRWIRNDGIYELIRIEPDRYVFSADAGEEVYFSKSLAYAGHKRFGRTQMEFNPLPTLDWPLAVGKQGLTTGRFLSYGEPYDADLTWRVEGVDSVVVPAGTFQAYRIRYRITPRIVSNFASRRGPNPTPSVTSLVFWYAPELKQFVKAEGDYWQVRFELVAADPGESEPLTIAVREPADQTSKGPGDSVSLIGTASAGKGVATLSVTVNGETVSTETPATDRRRTVSLDVPLPLRDGKNIVIVTATDGAGTSTQQARTVFYTAPMRVSFVASGPPVQVGQEHIALVVPLPHGKPIRGLTVAVNDVVSGSASGMASKEGSAQIPLKLTEGENRVRARIDLADGSQIVQDAMLVFANQQPAHRSSSRGRRRTSSRRQKNSANAPRSNAWPGSSASAGKSSARPRTSASARKSNGWWRSSASARRSSGSRRSSAGALRNSAWPRSGASARTSSAKPTSANNWRRSGSPRSPHSR